MPYVMIPVPEEHVEDVMGYVLRVRARASIEPWDAESVGQLFAEVDEPSRSLLSVVARATLTGKELSEREAGALIELSAREISGIERELRELSREGNRTALIAVDHGEETLPNGRTRRTRVLKMDDEVAAWVRDAEQAELESAPHPLEEPAQ